MDALRGVRDGCYSMSMRLSVRILFHMHYSSSGAQFSCLEAIQLCSDVLEYLLIQCRIPKFFRGDPHGGYLLLRQGRRV